MGLRCPVCGASMTRQLGSYLDEQALTNGVLGALGINVLDRLKQTLNPTKVPVPPPAAVAQMEAEATGPTVPGGKEYTPVTVPVDVPVTVSVPVPTSSGTAVATPVTVSVPIPTALDSKGNIVQAVKQPGFPSWMIYAGIGLAAVAVIYTVTRKKEP